MANRYLYWGLVLGCIALAGILFSWAIQTAWLGSFPGRDIALYRLHFYWQLGASAVFLVIALVVGIRFRRRASASPSERRDG